MMDISSLTAALLFVLGNILDYVYKNKFRSRSHFSYADFTALDPAFIEEEWEYLSEYRSLELAAGVMNAMAWFALMIPLLQVAWIQSHSGTRQVGVHVTVAALALGGSMTEFIARLLQIGTSLAGEWLAKDFNLDNWLSESSNDKIGWRTLQVVHLVVRGMLLWVDAAEWLALFGISVLLFVSIQRQTERLLSLSWASVGLAMGLLSLIDFAADVLRLESWRSFSEVTFWITMINRLVVLPVWLIWLGCQLPRAKEFAVIRRSDEKGLELSEEAAAPKMESPLTTVPLT
jgi:hypothetical protein